MWPSASQALAGYFACVYRDNEFYMYLNLSKVAFIRYRITLHEHTLLITTLFFIITVGDMFVFTCPGIATHQFLSRAQMQEG